MKDSQRLEHQIVEKNTKNAVLIGIFLRSSDVILRPETDIIIKFYKKSSKVLEDCVSKKAQQLRRI